MFAASGLCVQSSTRNARVRDVLKLIPWQILTGSGAKTSRACTRALRARKPPAGVKTERIAFHSATRVGVALAGQCARAIECFGVRTTFATVRARPAALAAQRRLL